MRKVQPSLPKPLHFSLIILALSEPYRTSKSRAQWLNHPTLSINRRLDFANKYIIFLLAAG